MDESALAHLPTSLLCLGSFMTTQKALPMLPPGATSTLLFEYCQGSRLGVGGRGYKHTGVQNSSKRIGGEKEELLKEIQSAEHVRLGR